MIAYVRAVFLSELSLSLSLLDLPDCLRAPCEEMRGWVVTVKPAYMCEVFILYTCVYIYNISADSPDDDDR